MNKNEYRRSLIMLRSLKPGISGYVRLERRTLMGSLQFTINGTPAGQELHAVLLRQENGGWSAVKAASFGPPRYGQSGLVWKFDPRSIENKPFEQYLLVAVIGISGGICDLLLCGTLNGNVTPDWTQVREAACRLFSPVRISGLPIPPIPESSPDEEKEMTDAPQILPDYSEKSPAYPGEEDFSSKGDHTDQPENSKNSDIADSGISPARDAENAIPSETPSVTTDLCPTGSGVSSHPDAENSTDSSSHSPADPDISEINREKGVRNEEDNQLLSASSGQNCACSGPETNSSDASHSNDSLPERNTLLCIEPAAQPTFSPSPSSADAASPADLPPDILDTPAVDQDELDTPAIEENQAFFIAARSALSGSTVQTNSIPEDSVPRISNAGDQLNLTDPDAAWPESIEPLRSLFFSSESIVPFEAEGYVFIRAPLPEETGVSSCVIGIRTEGGLPASVMYAIPAAYTPEPPAGLEGYVWYGNQTRGYWVITEQVTDLS